MADTLKLTSLSVVLPAFNEALNLPALIEKLGAVLPKLAHRFEIIIVNDGSVDNTKELIASLSQKNPTLRLITHPNNQGYGAALRSGFTAARYDWTFFTDADGQFDVSELAQFLPHTSTANVIIGYRRKRADGQSRAFNARLFKFFIDLIFRVHVKDIDCAFKLIKTSNLQSINFISTGAMISSEMLYRLKKQHQTFIQLPVTHYPRRWGTPTGNNIKVILKAGLEVIKLYLHLKFNIKL